MFDKILVPLDGSKLAEQVFPHVAELAAAFDSEVTLISVCEPEETEFGQVCRLYLGSEAELLAGIMGGSAVQPGTVVLVGKPAGKILDYAEENDVDIIVMASHGRSGIVPWSLGGTVSKVLHRVGVPLLIVRARETVEESDEAGLFERILVPMDGSKASEVVLPYVAEMAKRLQSEIILLQVVEAGRHVHTIGGLDYVPFKDQQMESAKARALEYLDQAKSGFAFAGAKVGCEVRAGDAAREIIEFAGETDCRLIAMSSHGHSGISAWMHGSITYKVLQAGGQSILLVPST